MWTILVIITIGIIVEGYRQDRKMKHYLDSLKEETVPDNPGSEKPE